MFVERPGLVAMRVFSMDIQSWTTQTTRAASVSYHGSLMKTTREMILVVLVEL
jgi:hypothetical protein